MAHADRKAKPHAGMCTSMCAMQQGTGHMTLCFTTHHRVQISSVVSPAGSKQQECSSAEHKS